MNKWIVAIVVLMFNATVGVAAQEPAQAQTCVACHGEGGVSTNPQWPNLAGQNALYLAAQVRAFRDGVRSNPAMMPVVAGLSDAEIDALANWFASRQAPTAASGDEKLVARGQHLAAYCDACHGNHGKPVANEWPILRGQHAPYLQQQLAAFKAGKRVNAHMQAAIARLGEAEFAALAAYYSQQRP